MSRWPDSTARWQRLRRKALAAQPMCSACAALGIDTPAKHVDHIKPIEQGGAVWQLSNLNCLCHSHHSQKTAADKLEQGDRWHLRGCNPDGTPRDPSHPWHT